MILETLKLSKRYGRLKAISDVDITVRKGEVFGILGPNGSGKTTTLSIITGILSQDSGNFSWFNCGNSPSIRQKIGPLIEIPHFYPYMNLVDNLKLLTIIKKNGERDIENVLEITGLIQRRKSRFNTLSLGMKQRLGIAAALLGNPDVLVLDEPTNGLDPEGIAEVRELITKQWKAGKTIIMASHLLGEVEKVCTSVAILKNGKVIEQGSVKALLGGENLLEICCSDMENLSVLLPECPFVSSFTQINKEIQVYLKEGKTPEDLNRFLFSKGITLNKLVCLKRTLESQFLELVKEEKQE